MISQDPVVTNPGQYRLLWENEFVRVLEYTDVPGVQTAPHAHPNSVMVTLSAFERRLNMDGQERDVSLQSAQAVWLPARNG